MSVAQNDEASGNFFLELSRWDVVCLRRILRRQQKKCLSEIRKHDERGWKPQPGCLDLSRTILTQVNGMLDRLGYPDDVQPEPKG